MKLDRAADILRAYYLMGYACQDCVLNLRMNICSVDKALLGLLNVILPKQTLPKAFVKNMITLGNSASF